MSDYVFVKGSHRHQSLKSLVAKMKPEANKKCKNKYDVQLQSNV
jgi:hypothetical protein